jgi:hypothetical protein
MTSRRGRFPRLALVTATLSALAITCGAIREDELSCEEAVSHLSACCAGFRSSSVHCVYSEGCTTNTYPDFTTGESECIRGESCDALNRNGVCQRAASLGGGAAIDGGYVTASQVCP